MSLVLLRGSRRGVGPSTAVLLLALGVLNLLDAAALAGAVGALGVARAAVAFERVAEAPAVGSALDNLDLSALGPASQGPVAKAAKGHRRLVANGSVLEVAGNVLHAVVPGVGAVELNGAVLSRAGHEGGKLTADAGRTGLHLADKVFVAAVLGLLAGLLDLALDVHAAQVLCVQVLAVEDAANGR